MSYHGETRILRHRLNALADAADRAQAGGDAFKSARRLVRVYDGGSMPTQPDHYFLCHPCEADGAEQEGVAPAFNCDSDTTLAVDFLNKAPVADDMAVATAVGGRWVAELGNSGSHICVVACGFKPVAGARADILDASGLTIASCTTGATGCCDVPASGTYRVRVIIGGTVAFDGTRTLSASTLIALSGSDAVVCCGDYLIPNVLTLTDANGTHAMAYSSLPSEATGNPTWVSVPYNITAPSVRLVGTSTVCNLDTVLSSGPVSICYSLTCFSGFSPHFQVSRAWTVVSGPAGITLFQDSPTQMPFTSFPACFSSGNPSCDAGIFFTQGGSGCFTDPSSTSPFALSCTPSGTGGGVPDPVGGSVAISA